MSADFKIALIVKPSLPDAGSLAGAPDYYLKCDDRFYQFKEKKSHFYQALTDWSQTSSGTQKILRLVSGIFHGISYGLKDRVQDFCFKEVAQGASITSDLFFFASVWKDLKDLKDNSLNFAKAAACAVQELIAYYFPTPENNDAAKAKQAMLDALLDMTIKMEKTAYSVGCLTKDILKVVQAVVKVPFRVLASTLKILSPVLDVWYLRYDIEASIVAGRVEEDLAQALTSDRIEVLNSDKNQEEINEAEAKTIFTSAKDVAGRTANRSWTDVALDALDLAVAAIGIIVMCLFVTTPIGWEIALGVAGFLVLLAVCVNKVSKNMIGGSLEEVKDQALADLKADLIKKLANKEDTTSSAKQSLSETNPNNPVAGALIPA